MASLHSSAWKGISKFYLFIFKNFNIIVTTKLILEDPLLQQIQVKYKTVQVA